MRAGRNVSDRHSNDEFISEAEREETSVSGRTDSSREMADLARLKKKDLLEIMLAQSKEIDRLRDLICRHPSCH